MATRANFRRNFAIVGCTGMVGQEVLKVLEDRNIEVGELKLGASSRSAGQTMEFKGEDLTVREVNSDFFNDVDVAVFSAGSSVSETYAPVAAGKGVLVIDNTSFFRLEPDVPLCVPEINGEELSVYPERNIISVPNCSTIGLMMALYPLHELALASKVVVSTYQSVSGAGRKAMEELSDQITDLYNFKESQPSVFPKAIAFDLIPQIGALDEHGHSGEEKKMIEETRKILGEPDLDVVATAVRVPTFRGHGLSVYVEFERDVDLHEIKAAWSRQHGLTLVDDPIKGTYPMLLDVQGEDDVLVGRIRMHNGQAKGVSFWSVSDNLRKGAALNAVQIAELCIKRLWI